MADLVSACSDKVQQHQQSPSSLMPTPYGSCDRVSGFKKINRIGEGTYGYVYSAKNIRTGEIVALKRIIMHNESQDGFPLTSLREVKTLRRCGDHPNIVKLLDVVVGSKRDQVFLLFEYCENDLATLMINKWDANKKNKKKRQRSDDNNATTNTNTITTTTSSNTTNNSSSSSGGGGGEFPLLFKESEVKCLIRQLLSALEFMHRNHVIHRDIKLSNLLYTRNGQLKVADFGLARTVSSPCDHDSNNLLTTKVVTLWYRAPELLLGCTHYSFAIDMWSAGCIFAELLSNEPLLPGDDEMDQCRRIFKLLGSPDERIWEGVSDLQAFSSGMLDLSAMQEQYRYNDLEDRITPFVTASFVIPAASKGGSGVNKQERKDENTKRCLDFVNSLLIYDPDLRATARDSARHAYFSSSPLPTEEDLMPTFPSQHSADVDDKQKSGF